jgi:hypothetical protein
MEINEFLMWAATGITVVAFSVGGVTMVLSVWYQYRSRRREEIRERIQPELFERLFSAEDPEWSEWVETISKAERRQLEHLLDEYVRKLRGTERDRLRELGMALDIQNRARTNLEDDRKRFGALTWLALLEAPVDPERLEACCSESPRLRAAAARVLHEGDTPNGSRAGTELLVDGDSLTAFGMDTLYRLNNGTGTPLLSLLEADADTWNERLLVQVLIVLRYCNIADPGGRLEWLPELLEHDSPRIRAAAVGVLERHGWRETFQSRIDIETLLGDSEATVRHDTYLLLAAWNTEQSAVWLRRALTTVEEKTDTLALVRAYRAHSRTDLSVLPPRFDPFVEWVTADEAVSRHRSVWGVSAAWA